MLSAVVRLISAAGAQRGRRAFLPPSVYLMPGTELARSPGGTAGQVADGAAETQRVEALPVSGGARMLAQLCPTLTVWVTLAVLGGCRVCGTWKDCRERKGR